VLKRWQGAKRKGVEVEREGAEALTIGDGQMLTLLDLGCSHYPQPMNWPVNPDVENTDWRAVCVM